MPTDEEINGHNDKLKNGKTSGEDVIIAELLKNMGLKQGKNWEISSEKYGRPRRCWKTASVLSYIYCTKKETEQM